MQESFLTIELTHQNRSVFSLKMYYIYQIDERYLSIKWGDANPTGGIINNYIRTVQVSIFSAGFPLFSVTR